MGTSTTVHWPVGQGEQANGGITETLGLSQGLSDVEWFYAVKLHLPVALLQNQTGAFLAPSIAGALAVAGFPTIPSDLRLYLVNAPGVAAYPLTGYSWMIVYQQQNDVEKSRALASLLWWVVHQGQHLCPLTSHDGQP